jgi:cytochrome c-type biogenesis protein CcmF
MGSGNFLTGLGLFLAGFITGSVIQQIIPTLRSGRPGMSFWAMQLGHLGVVVFAVGVTMVSTWEEEKDVRMEVGQTVTVGGYTFKMMGLQNVPGPNYSATRGTFEAMPTKGGKVLHLYPEKRQYFSSTMPMTEADIDYGFTRDIYVSLGEPLDDGQAWAVRVYYKPFVSWIWGGCVVMSIGGLLAVIDRRYRKLIQSVKPSSAGKVAA